MKITPPPTSAAPIYHAVSGGRLKYRVNAQVSWDWKTLRINLE